MGTSYEILVNEANKLMKTYTITYNVQNYSNELFSSTYDELSGWVKSALKLVETTEEEGRESELYKSIRKFRGRAGDLSLTELQKIVSNLNQGHI